jgi:hypothetical protein
MDENEAVCVSCEVETDDLNDEGRCDECQFAFDIRRAEYARDMAEDR